MEQQRLFDPGPEAPDPWKNHPDEWVKRPDVVYHASYYPSLPRKDRGPGKDVGYGGSQGMHFGDKAAAFDRSRTSLSQRPYIHTARLNAGQFTNIKGGPWSDTDANHSDAAEDAVSRGFVVPYYNDHEGNNSISYRARAESVKTWSEDVKDDPHAHPALKHLADVGYNPTVDAYEVRQANNRAYDERRNGVFNPQLFAADILSNKDGKAVAHTVTEAEAFDRRQNFGGTYAGVRRNNIVIKYEEENAIDGVRPRMRPGRDEYGY